MYIAYKFRIYPTDEQKIIINKNFELNFNARQIKIPKLKWVNIRGYRKLKYIFYEI